MTSMKKKLQTVTCNKCGWVSYEISRKDAETSIRLFNLFFDRLSEKDRKDLYGDKRTSMDDYNRCCSCGNDYHDFSDAESGDCPDGVTLGPILSRLE